MREQLGVIMCVARLDVRIVAQLLCPSLEVCSPSVLPRWQTQGANISPPCMPFSLGLQVQATLSTAFGNDFLVDTELVVPYRVALEIDLYKSSRFVAKGVAERAAFVGLRFARGAPDSCFHASFGQRHVERAHHLAACFVEALQVRPVPTQDWIVAGPGAPSQDPRQAPCGIGIEQRSLRLSP